MAYMKQSFLMSLVPTTGATGYAKVPVFRSPFPCIIDRFSAWGFGTATGTITLLKNASAVSSGVAFNGASTSKWATKQFTTGLTADAADSLEVKLEKIAGASVGASRPISVQIDVKIDQWYLHMGN